jgi:hypothetical protein
MYHSFIYSTSEDEDKFSFSSLILVENLKQTQFPTENYFVIPTDVCRDNFQGGPILLAVHQKTTTTLFLQR